MKRCGKCKLEKTLDNFYKSPKRYDGLRGYCKECERKINRSLKLYHREYYVKNSEKIIKRSRYFDIKFADKKSARNRLNDAIRTGKIIRKLCAICGDMKTQGHHTDYSKPLEVVWLCSVHHRLADIGELKFI